MKITDLTKKYLESKGKTVREITLKISGSRLNSFCDFLKDNQIEQPEDLTFEAIKAFQLCSEHKRLTAKSLYMDLYEPKKFLDYLYQNSYTLLNISEEILLPKLTAANTPKLNTAEALKLIEELKISPEEYSCRDRAITALFLLEKLSFKHIYNLSILDLNLEEDEIRISAKKKFIRIKKETIKYLRAYLRTRPQLKPITDWVFVNRKGARIAQNSLKRFMRGVLLPLRRGDLRGVLKSQVNKPRLASPS